MKKHTPGPWKIVEMSPPFVEYPGYAIKRDDDVQFPVAFVAKTRGGLRPPTLANAALIACAPELLAECEILVQVVEKKVETSTELDAIVSYAKQLIAKAKGEQ